MAAFFWLILFLLFVGFTFMPWKASEAVAKKVKARWGSLVSIYASRHPGLSVNRVLAMICYESAGNPEAVNPEKHEGQYDDSVGLMQVTDPAIIDFNTAFGKAYRFDMLTTPSINIEIGCGYLALRFRKWKDLDKATRAYNGGDGGVNIPATAVYLQRVKAYEKLIEGLA